MGLEVDILNIVNRFTLYSDVHRCNTRIDVDVQV